MRSRLCFYLESQQRKSMSSLRSAIFFVLLGTISGLQQPALAQHQPTAKEQANIANNAARHFGDAPDNPGPIATDLSYSTKPAAVGKAMRKVADWQVER